MWESKVDIDEYKYCKLDYVADMAKNASSLKENEILNKHRSRNFYYKSCMKNYLLNPDKGGGVEKAAKSKELCEYRYDVFSNYTLYMEYQIEYN